MHGKGQGDLPLPCLDELEAQLRIGLDRATQYERGLVTVDLDAKKAEREAARREAGKTGPVIKMGGKNYELSPELSYDVLEALKGLDSADTAGGALLDMVEKLLGEHYAAFRATNPSLEDVTALLVGVMEEYGIDNPLPS